MDRRTRQRQQTAAEIVDAAEQVVLEADLEGLTVQAVASALGMTPGALYRYFPSRDAVVAAVQARVVEQLAQALEQAVSEVETPLERLFAAAEATLRFARQQPRRYGLLSRMLAVPRPLVGEAEAARVLPGALAAAARVEGLFAEARRQGVLREGDDRVRLGAWWAAVHGAIQLAKLGRFVEQAAAEPIAREALAAMAQGWGAPAETVGRAVHNTFGRPR
jgi:AcrR family transcriptional regulator